MLEKDDAGSVSGQLAIVTGGGRGIGRAVCNWLVNAGARVAILDIDAHEAEYAASLMPKGQASWQQCDVTDMRQLEDAARRILERQGPWAVLVSNVGWSPHRYYLDMSPEERDQLMKLNLSSALYTTSTFLPEMVRRSYGRICFIGSDAGRAGSPGQSVYAAAKAGIVGFAKSLAAEVARNNVTVNVVSPGSTNTRFLREVYGEQSVTTRGESNPTGRIAEPEDVANAVGFLVSPTSGFITGQTLSVNGGTMRF